MFSLDKDHILKWSLMIATCIEALSKINLPVQPEAVKMCQ